jgi:hypothetical protein
MLGLSSCSTEQQSKVSSTETVRDVSVLAVKQANIPDVLTWVNTCGAEAAFLDILATSPEKNSCFSAKCRGRSDKQNGAPLKRARTPDVQISSGTNFAAHWFHQPGLRSEWLLDHIDTERK